MVGICLRSIFISVSKLSNLIQNDHLSIIAYFGRIKNLCYCSYLTINQLEYIDDRHFLIFGIIGGAGGNSALMQETL